MFNIRYFAVRYFAPRYFANVGAAGGPVGPSVLTTESPVLISGSGVIKTLKGSDALKRITGSGGGKGI